jgi:hypothetical protein
VLFYFRSEVFKALPGKDLIEGKTRPACRNRLTMLKRKGFKELKTFRILKKIKHKEACRIGTDKREGPPEPLIQGSLTT